MELHTVIELDDSVICEFNGIKRVIESAAKVLPVFASEAKQSPFEIATLPRLHRPDWIGTRNDTAFFSDL